MLLSSVNLTREEKRDRHYSHNEKDCGYQGGFCSVSTEL